MMIFAINQNCWNLLVPNLGFTLRLLLMFLGSVDVDLSGFVRINSNFIAARGMMLSYSKFMSCNNEKMGVKRTRWAALSVFFVTLSSIYVE